MQKQPIHFKKAIGGPKPESFEDQLGFTTEAPGLVVFLDEQVSGKGRWQIAHLPTGLCVISGFGKIDQALNCAKDLAGVEDWTQEQVLRDPSAGEAATEICQKYVPW